MRGGLEGRVQGGCLEFAKFRPRDDNCHRQPLRSSECRMEDSWLILPLLGTPSKFYSTLRDRS
jgi:hypothetical protein